MPMNGIWGPNDVLPQAVHHGVMAKGNWGADYYTSQPDPSRWIAVGLAAPLDTGSPVLGRMLVGEGSTEDEAINSLWVRVSELSGDSQCTIFPEPSTHQDQQPTAEPNHRQPTFTRHLIRECPSNTEDARCFLDSKRHALCKGLLCISGEAHRLIV
jgi:hypothetical protein